MSITVVASVTAVGSDTRKTMYKAKIVVVYCGAADLRGCRLALGIAEGAWDGGAEVRVRCMQRLVPPADMLLAPEWVDALGETDGVAVASAEDLAWADAVCVGASADGDIVRAQLANLLRALRPGRGCIVVTSGASTASALGVQAHTSAPTDKVDAPSARELETAREEGLRIAEATLALLVARSPLAVA
jgi:hypothetical protein